MISVDSATLNSLPSLPPSARQRLLIKAELRRRAIRANSTEWAVHALRDQGLKPAKHHRYLLQELDAVLAGRTKRLMINLPPGSAKSTFASVLFPAFALAQKPYFNIIGASNVAALAEEFSGKIQDLVRDNSSVLGYRLASESKERWFTTNGGGYKAAGVGGTITGFRADGAICDDLVRGRADAESDSQRDKAWAWFKADLRTRLKPGAFIILIGTRWHSDDVFARCLNETTGLWRVVDIPAYARENDPIGRAPGEPLWADDDYGYAEELKLVEQELGERDWSALYQQRPTPGGGGLFKANRINYHDALPARCDFVRSWDLAATKQVGTNNPSWTVGTLLARARDGTYGVADVVRFRGPPEEVEAAIQATATRDGRVVPISIPQDGGQAGKSQVAALARLLAGYDATFTPETGDKATRAAPFAAQVNVGNVWCLRAPWNDALIGEMLSFPGGKHDDQIDALSRGFAYLAEGVSKRRKWEAMSS